MWFASLMLAFAAFANALANLLMKKASLGVQEVPLSLYLNPYFIGGGVLFGLNLLVYMQTLKTFPLSVAYPILVGGSLLIITIISPTFFQEIITLKQIAGMILIVTGISLVV